MIHNHFQALTPHGFKRIAYTERGEPDNPHVVICVHGLTRNSRDFDFLSEALARDCRVVCVDMPGRGDSERLEHPEDYAYPVYLSICAALIARVTAPLPPAGLRDRVKRWLRGPRPVTLDWVGTSMGGLIGMMLAANGGCPVRRMVMNDIGPMVPKEGLERIGKYVGKDPRFPSLEALEGYLREFSKPFGPLTDGQWRHLALHGSRRHDDGSWGLSYDPEIAAPFRAAVFADVSLWPIWDQVRCEVLALRGLDSDLLVHEIAREMQTRGPGAKVVEFPGVGHAPMLMSEDQISVVRDFLLGA